MHVQTNLSATQWGRVWCTSFCPSRSIPLLCNGEESGVLPFAHPDQFLCYAMGKSLVYYLMPIQINSSAMQWEESGVLPYAHPDQFLCYAMGKSLVYFLMPIQINSSAMQWGRVWCTALCPSGSIPLLCNGEESGVLPYAHPDQSLCYAMGKSLVYYLMPIQINSSAVQWGRVWCTTLCPFRPIPLLCNGEESGVLPYAHPDQSLCYAMGKSLVYFLMPIQTHPSAMQWERVWCTSLCPSGPIPLLCNGEESGVLPVH